MKTIRWILIGSRIFALTCGLTVLASGCDSTPPTSTPPLSQEETKRNEDTRKAMEEASKAQQKK